jgi:hypothetical protein
MYLNFSLWFALCNLVLVFLYIVAAYLILGSLSRVWLYVKNKKSNSAKQTAHLENPACGGTTGTLVFPGCGTGHGFTHFSPIVLKRFTYPSYSFGKFFPPDRRLWTLPGNL